MPLDDVVSPLEDVAPEEVVPLEDAVVSPDDPNRPLSLEPPHATAMLAPTNAQEAENQARRIR